MSNLNVTSDAVHNDKAALEAMWLKGIASHSPVAMFDLARSSPGRIRESITDAMVATIRQRLEMLCRQALHAAGSGIW